MVSRGAPAFEALQPYEPAASGGGGGRGVERGERNTSLEAGWGEIYVLMFDTRQMSVRNLVPILVRTTVVFRPGQLSSSILPLDPGRLSISPSNKRPPSHAVLNLS